jgi:Tol biopolymer transport system component
MKLSWGIPLILALAACQGSPPAEKDPKARPPMGGDDVKDHTMPLNAAEPPWRDIIRHTVLPLPGKAMHPGPSLDGAFFAYATTEFGPRLQIALRETFDASPLQITSNSGDNLFPRVSPDAKHIAYASNRDGNFDIYVTRIDAPGSVTQVTFEPGDDICPSWSPDGKKLVYSSKMENGVWQIVMVDVGTRIKTFLGPGIYPDWSPDPKSPWITFQSLPKTPGGRSGVWCVKTDGTGLREVVGDTSNTWSAINPHFSPDGKWIAYATVNKSVESRNFGVPLEADDIWIVRADGTYPMRLTDDLSAEWWPAWGGDRVFFVTNRGGMQNICSVRVKPLEDPK